MNENSNGKQYKSDETSTQSMNNFASDHPEQVHDSFPPIVGIEPIQAMQQNNYANSNYGPSTDSAYTKHFYEGGNRINLRNSNVYDPLIEQELHLRGAFLESLPFHLSTSNDIQGQVPSHVFPSSISQDYYQTQYTGQATFSEIDSCQVETSIHNSQSNDHIILSHRDSTCNTVVVFEEKPSSAGNFVNWRFNTLAEIETTGYENASAAFSPACLDQRTDESIQLGWTGEDCSTEQSVATASAERRNHRNARDRKSAQEKKKRVASIEEKAEHMRTAEEDALVRSFYSRRERKNARGRQRAKERKELLSAIFAKPEEQRSLLERQYLENEFLKTMKRKEVDKRRHAGQKVVPTDKAEGTSERHTF